MSSTTIPLNDLKRTFAARAPDLLRVAGEVLASGWWLNGQELESFCTAFARYVGVDHCIGVANGTDALELAIRALVRVRRPSGREVVTVANAGGYSTTACLLTGLVPVYADIREDTQLASIESVAACVSADTALVIATHLYGGAVDVPALRDALAAAGHGDVPVLEDCAQAHGARVGGRGGPIVGSLGDVAAFSFYPTKNLGAFGDGGAVVTSDTELAAAVRALRQYGWGAKYEVSVAGGRNSRLDEVQAALLGVLLPGLDEANARRRAVLSRYVEAAPPGVRVVDVGEGSVAHLAVLLADDRDGLRAHLSGRGITADVHYPILDCDQPAWRDRRFRTAPGGLPVSRRSVGRLLTLPCFPEMRGEEVDRVCEALSAWRA